MSRIVLITGASSGIGAALADTYTWRDGYVVYAGYYGDPADHADLILNPGLIARPCDVTDAKQLVTLFEEIQKNHDVLDTVINCAGVYLNKDLLPLDNSWDDYVHSFDVNFGGMWALCKVMYPLLRLGTEKRVVSLTSRWAIEHTADGRATPYRMSKVALNMLIVSLARAYAHDDMTFLGIEPGWVRTEMTDYHGDRSPEEAAEKILQAIEWSSLSDSGRIIYA